MMCGYQKKSAQRSNVKNNSNTALHKQLTEVIQRYSNKRNKRFAHADFSTLRNTISKPFRRH